MAHTALVEETPQTSLQLSVTDEGSPQTHNEIKEAEVAPDH